MLTILQLNNQFKVNDEYFSKNAIFNLPNNRKQIICKKVIDSTNTTYGLIFSENTGQWDLESWDGQQWGLEEANVKVSD